MWDKDEMYPKDIITNTNQKSLDFGKGDIVRMKSFANKVVVEGKVLSFEQVGHFSFANISIVKVIDDGTSENMSSQDRPFYEVGRVIKCSVQFFNSKMWSCFLQ